VAEKPCVTTSVHGTMDIILGTTVATASASSHRGESHGLLEDIPAKADIKTPRSTL
jgi:hypothetical protein